MEIERKYLVISDEWKKYVTDSVSIIQGYAFLEKGVFRIRIAGKKAFLTVKGRQTGICRAEFEYEIPLHDAETMLETICEPGKIEKTRYLIPHGKHTIELDVFDGKNRGLVIAEIELEHENTPLSLPKWIGQEVSTDLRYTNSNLVKNPFCHWK